MRDLGAKPPPNFIIVRRVSLCKHIKLSQDSMIYAMFVYLLDIGSEKCSCPKNVRVSFYSISRFTGDQNCSCSSISRIPGAQNVFFLIFLRLRVLTMVRFTISTGSQVLRMVCFPVFPSSEVLKMVRSSEFPGSKGTNPSQNQINK